MSTLILHATNKDLTPNLEGGDGQGIRACPDIQRTPGLDVESSSLACFVILPLTEVATPSRFTLRDRLGKQKKKPKTLNFNAAGEDVRFLRDNSMRPRLTLQPLVVDGKFGNLTRGRVTDFRRRTR